MKCNDYLIQIYNENLPVPLTGRTPEQDARMDELLRCSMIFLEGIRWLNPTKTYAPGLPNFLKKSIRTETLLSIEMYPRLAYNATFLRLFKEDMESVNCVCGFESVRNESTFDYFLSVSRDAAYVFRQDDPACPFHFESE